MIIKDIDLNKPLMEYCRNATNKEGDTFVGIKSEIKNDIHEIQVSFPIGYRLPKTEDEANEDIINLITVLQDNMSEEARIDKIDNEQLLKTVKFPINSYFVVVFDYLKRGSYYRETEEVYKKKPNGRISMKQTILRAEGIPQKTGIAYLDIISRATTDTDKDLITKVSHYCVYESLSKLGWMYKLQTVEKPNFENENDRFQMIIESKLRRENNDDNKKLFFAMLDVLNYRDNAENPDEFYFGTNRFEYIWEKLIDNTFGVKNKQYYFPKTKWQLVYGDKNKTNVALEPDTIMKYDGDIYVLDAKYYKYGETRIPNHLPDSSSINKQITYGEYISENEKFKEELANKNIYNAFILPYSKENMLFKFEDEEKKYLNIGKAVSEWKSNDKTYENVQGILVDVKDLMKNTMYLPKKELFNLANEIKKYI